MRALEAYESLPASNQVGGAFGGKQRKAARDRDIALKPGASRKHSGATSPMKNKE